MAGYKPERMKRGLDVNNMHILIIYTNTRGAESEPDSKSPGVVATSQESESESVSIKLPQLRLRNVLCESSYAGENLHALFGTICADIVFKLLPAEQEARSEVRP